MGHGLGNIVAVPILSLVASGAAARWVRTATRARVAEAAALLALVGATAGAVFSQAVLPLLFVPILPAMLATFRIGRLGAAASVVIMAAVGGVLTLRGHGPVNLIDGDAALRAQFFLFYLAVTVLTVLPVAAELRHRHRLFERLSESEARYRLLADHSSDIVLSVRPDGVIRYASPAIAQLGGCEPEAVLGRVAADLVLPEHRAALVRAHRIALASPARTVRAEYRAEAADGEPRWFESNMRAVRDEAGLVTGAVSIVRDIDARKRREGELSRAAATDPLTGLANRRAFDDALDRLLSTGTGGCLAVLDIDHFKRVNDRHGHAAGDRVLVAFAELARGALRDGDLVARLGGEEFGLLLPGAAPDRARAVCERVRRVVADARVPAGEGVVRVTVSAGLVALDARTPRADLVRAADEALYRAKADGRDRLRLAA